MKQLLQVKEFMQLMGQETPTIPQIPSQDIIELRHKLVAEENDEILVAVQDNDIVGIADGIADSLYVVLGEAWAYGLAPILPDLFDEVQRSNMSKACKTEEEAEATLDFYINQEKTNETEGEYTYFPRRVGEYWIIMRSDGKAMKSVDYSEANLAPIVEHYIASCHNT